MNIFKRKNKRELKELFETRFMKISTLSSNAVYIGFQVEECNCNESYCTGWVVEKIGNPECKMHNGKLIRDILNGDDIDGYHYRY